MLWSYICVLFYLLLLYNIYVLFYLLLLNVCVLCYLLLGMGLDILYNKETVKRRRYFQDILARMEQSYTLNHEDFIPWNLSTIILFYYGMTTWTDLYTTNSEAELS